MTRAELTHWLVEHAGLCGCSNEDHVVAFLRDLLEAGELRDFGKQAEADAVLEEMLPEGDCLERNLPMYWLGAIGLTTHGDALDEYGLSELGDDVLSALRRYGTGDELWEDWDDEEGNEEVETVVTGEGPDRSLN